MVNFQDFTVTCNECGSKASIEVLKAEHDGDAVVIATCEKCQYIEGIQTEMDDIEED